MRGFATRRGSDMRFVIHCALLLFAFVGLATEVDRWTATTAKDDMTTLGVCPPDSSDEASVAMCQARNGLHLRPLFLVVLGLATVAVYRPGFLRHWKFTLGKMRPGQKSMVKGRSVPRNFKRASH
jgi:hypothetical protein